VLEPYADALRQMILEKKGITLREIQAHRAEQGIVVKALSTIAEMLHRLDLSHKNVWPAPFASGDLVMGTVRSASTYPAFG
jgi:hypothetical protein